MRYLFKLFWLILILISEVNAQNEHIDSLKNLLPQLLEDTSKVNTLLEISKTYLSTSLDSSKNFALEAIKLSEAIGFEKGKGDVYRSLIYIYSNKAKYDTAMHYLSLAKPIHEALGDKTRDVELGNLEANILEKKGDYLGSQSKYYELLKVCEKNGYYLDQIDILNALAVQSLGQHDVEGSVRFLNQSLELAKVHKYVNKEIRACINLSIANDSINLRRQYLERAIYLTEPLKLNRELGYIYSAKALLETNLGNYNEAIKLYHKGIGITKLTGDKLKENRIYKSIGEAFLSTERPDSSEYYLKKYLLANYEDFRHSKYIGKKLLSEALAYQHKFEEAYDTLTEAYVESSELYQKNLSDNMSEADSKYEAEKKDAELIRQELELEKNSNERKMILGGFFILLTLLSGIYFWYLERQKRLKKETELALFDEQKEAERLRELDNMKSSFFTNVSHELRTPLTLILGPLSDALEKIDNQAVKKSVHMAHSNAEKLLDMVNEVMELSKLESRQIELRQKDINLKSFLHRVVFAFESMALLRGVKLILNENLGVLYIRVDDSKLEKIMNNLISNAIKFSPENTSVSIRAEVNNSTFTFSVMDEGKGIHPDETEKIFNRFYQSNIITAVEGGGTGVGLALCKELTELLGGSLVVESQLGQGSTFVLNIPIEVLESTKEKIESEDYDIINDLNYTPILINGSKPHILVIEDNQEMCAYLESILKDEFRLSFAEDGYVALQKLQKMSFDIISSDIMMPKMDGFELKEKVNRLLGLKMTPFIFLSARSLEEDKLKGLQLGVDDYITKPFNKDELKARINNLLRNKLERESWIEENGVLKPEVNNLDEDLLKRAESSILKNISNPEYKVNDLALDLNYSQRQLTRLLKKLTGMAPVNFILELRLLRAYDLLNSRKYQTSNEVRYEVGIESASYFTRKFKERFGVSPGSII